MTAKTMPSSMTTTRSVLVSTEQHAGVPTSGPESMPLPQEFWAVLVLSLILFVLLAWRAIDEMVNGSDGDDNKSVNNFPPF